MQTESTKKTMEHSMHVDISLTITHERTNVFLRNHCCVYLVSLFFLVTQYNSFISIL